ncbi:MAG TPA: HEPN-associated N-terminal domain-containing protein [Symbiobacteriaceae bacterium]|nr:HEPN-associated N-terminal domain-containing protein [Symbiobacteriaceae bacterium]
MGFMKHKLMEEQERGWASLGDKYVCDQCFDDYALTGFVQEHASSPKCDYCGRRSKRKPIAAPVDDVVEYIHQGVILDWGNPNDELPYETREGGFQGNVVDAYDLFQDGKRQKEPTVQHGGL